MNFESLLVTARQGRLYPSVILYGGSLEQRQQAALEIARTVLCGAPPEQRPCDPENPHAECSHCRRLLWPEKGAERFHPDLHVLERDLRTSTSVEGTKKFLSNAYASPFEARGQVFVIAEAETLTGGAADALLKLLEEPPMRSPRYFLLLAASRLDLLTTLRSRSLSMYMGSRESLDPETVEEIGEKLTHCLDVFMQQPSGIYILTAAEVLAGAKGWDDPRARRPWAMASAAILHFLDHREVAAPLRRALLDLAEELLDGPRLRLRGITHVRILEGLLTQHLAAHMANPGR